MATRAIYIETSTHNSQQLAVFAFTTISCREPQKGARAFFHDLGVQFNVQTLLFLKRILRQVFSLLVAQTWTHFWLSFSHLQSNCLAQRPFFCSSSQLNSNLPLAAQPVGLDKVDGEAVGASLGEQVDGKGF